MGRLAKPLPPLAELQRLFTYNPETGELTRNVSRGPRHPVGSVAGCKLKCKHTTYIQVQIGEEKHYAHRICWALFNGKQPTAFIDHINGDGTDNRSCNLRHVSDSVNRRNLQTKPAGAFGVRGVLYRSEYKNRPFVAYWPGASEQYHSTLLDAVAARKSAEQRLGYL